MTHRYAEMLGWLQAGEQILGKWNGGVEAKFPDAFNSQYVTYAVEGAEGWDFRLKPRTVKIGSREVEAPVLEPVEGQTVYRAVEDEEECVAVDFCVHYKQIAADGRYFLSPEAALAARAAVVALLRGEA